MSMKVVGGMTDQEIAEGYVKKMRELLGQVIEVMNQAKAVDSIFFNFDISDDAHGRITLKSLSAEKHTRLVG